MVTTQNISRLALTLGEPAGIGYELFIQLVQQPQPCELIAIGDPSILAQRAKWLDLPLNIHVFDPLNPAQINSAQSIKILPVMLPDTVVCGTLNVNNSGSVVETIRLATQGCLDGLFDGMVTAPIHKGIINDAGILFSGHTEFIAEITGGHPVMMLATEGLRVALVTTHLPLASVSQEITAERLTSVITLLDRDLRDRFFLSNPKILVCGLNPHAGENGHLGREEIETIEPTLKKLIAQGINLHGPLPADTLFTPKYLETADAVLAMYHDQGLPVLKHKGFGRAVNITLGLPIIRTSVDHGTALDLAGTGQADIGSLQLAIKTAIDMVNASTTSI
ncbi:MAG: 4-hydroxythreonine-4-phosphate dehydrogenase PdxA [Methylococcales bacterium]|nr:4-hydroxythreonine-4-phosphate dehydrogenase PdxA [Methylococcales bacterium]